MLKLFVDDLRECPEGWHLARTITEAVRVLATMPVSVVSLDHDILYEDYKGGKSFSTETFATVAFYIAAMADCDRPKKIFIHTANPNGALRMEETLTGKVPDVQIIFCDSYKEILGNWADGK